MSKGIIVKAVDLVFRLRDCGYINTSGYEGFAEWLLRAIALVCAYYGERIHEADTTNIRMLHVFESYNKDNPALWTVIAYLWHNDIGDEYAFSLYERDCLDDDYYIKMGTNIKEVVE